MNDKKTLAILTPSYNRAYTLTVLYESLKSQTSFDFKWYVVDDGSEDNTEELVKSFINDNFEITYLKKGNGGKHTAINYGLRYIQEELTFIVDSDDYLTVDAVEQIIKDYTLYRNEVCGLSYYRLNENATVIGDAYRKSEPFISSFIEERINRNVKGDKAEIYKTDILKQFPFKEFQGEKFLSEAVVWNAISNAGYKLAFIPKGIYYCDYLEDGLTKQGRLKQLKTPLGSIEHAKAFLYPEVKLSIKFKYMIMYIALNSYLKRSSRIAIKGCRQKVLFILCWIPGKILNTYWKIKYKRQTKKEKANS